MGTKIKICGISRLEDIEAVNIAKPDYIGFVFAKSPRQISPDRAKALKARLDGGISAVGVFVNEDIDIIARLCDSGTIDMVQLHGNEDEEYMKSLKKVIDKPIIKAFRIRDGSEICATSADYLLFDSFVPDKYGGSGRAFDWSVIKGARMPFFLAGGINRENVEKAIKTAKPYCIDVSSAVETDGLKDGKKIIEFVRIVRGIKL